MEHLCTHTDGLLLGRSTHRTDHKFLEGDRRIRVSTTIDDIHHRNRKSVSIATADVAIQWDVKILSSSMSHSQRNTEDGIGTQIRLGLGTVELQHLIIDGTLLQGRKANQSRTNHLIHILHGLQDTLAAIAVLVAITKFQSLVLTSGCTRRNRCTTYDT